MKKTRFTEGQIFSILRETDNGLTVEQVCRNHGISSSTYYKWKSKYGGMSAPDMAKLKSMEQELSKLKKMYAELSLENVAAY